MFARSEKLSPEAQRRQAIVRASNLRRDPATGSWSRRDTSSGRFCDIKKNGGAFKGVVREDGCWHRRPGRRLVRNHGPHAGGHEYKQVSLLAWLIKRPLFKSRTSFS